MAPTPASPLAARMGEVGERCPRWLCWSRPAPPPAAMRGRVRRPAAVDGDAIERARIGAGAPGEKQLRGSSSIRTSGIDPHSVSSLRRALRPTVMVRSACAGAPYPRARSYRRSDRGDRGRLLARRTRTSAASTPAWSSPSAATAGRRLSLRVLERGDRRPRQRECQTDLSRMNSSTPALEEAGCGRSPLPSSGASSHAATSRPSAARAPPGVPRTPAVRRRSSRETRGRLVAEHHFGGDVEADEARASAERRIDESVAIGSSIFPVVTPSRSATRFASPSPASAAVSSGKP